VLKVNMTLHVMHGRNLPDNWHLLLRATTQSP